MNYHTLSPRILLSFLAVSLTLLSAVSFALLPTDAQTSELTLTPLGEVVGFDDIEGVAFDDKYIYVTEMGGINHDSSIKIFDKTTITLSTTIGLGTSSPNGVALSDNYIYVTQNSANALVMYNKSDNSFYKSVSLVGSGFNQLSDFNYGPYFMHVDKNDNKLYVADMGNNRVQLYSLDGTFIGTFANVEKPIDVYVYGDYVYVASFLYVYADHPFTIEKTLGMYAKNGTLVKEFGGDGTLKFLYGVTVDDKYIYVSETGDSSQIKGYRNNGSEAPVTSVSVGLVDTGNILAGVSDQNQIRIDCDKLYVADYGNHRLLVLQSNYNSCTGADPSSS